MNHRWCRFPVLLGSCVVALGLSIAAQADEDRPASEGSGAGASQIATWIAELDHNQFVVRERASAALLESGAEALDPLLATANGDSPEPAERAVWILRKLSVGKDVALRRSALERLVEVKDRPQVVAAARETLASIRHQEAVAAVKEQGAQFVSPYADSTTPLIVQRVVLDEKWTGGNAGLRHLADLRGLQHVIIIGADINAEGLAELAKIELLEELWLYRTRITADEKAAFEKDAPRVQVDYRRGAILGIGPRTDPTGPVFVGNVHPGSAADKAGIRTNDAVLTFNGEKVTDFNDLTKKIAEHLPGDEVKLGLKRGSDEMELSVKLGSWSAEQVLNQRLPQ